MSDLVFHHFQTGLSPEILAVFKEELLAGGIVEGIFGMGPAPIDRQSIFMMWVHSADLRAISTVPRSAFEGASRARATAQEFVLKCVGHRERILVEG